MMLKFSQFVVEKKNETKDSIATTATSSPLRGQNQDQSGYSPSHSTADYTISDSKKTKIKEGFVGGVGAVRQTPVTMKSAGSSHVKGGSHLQHDADRRRVQLDKVAQQRRDQQEKERQRQQQQREKEAAARQKEAERALKPGSVKEAKAVSQAQQKAAGAALATQRGEYAGGVKGGAVNRMALMKRKDLEKIAGTKRKELPVHKEEVELDEKLTDAAKENIRMAISDKMKKTSKPARALIKLAKSNPKNVKENEELDEARRGRPPKNKTAEDPGSDNIIMQLRKVITLRGQAPVTFVDGKKANISPATAHRLLAQYDNLKTSLDKHTFSQRIHKSADSMRDVIAGKKEIVKPKISLGGSHKGK